jgi:prepilin-type N-terminal cleavage/methylation domain-containing protein
MPPAVQEVFPDTQSKIQNRQPCQGLKNEPESKIENQQSKIASPVRGAAMNPNRKSKIENRKSRGVTLVEMLVTVAILVIIMTVMVQVFQAATGALTTAQTVHDLDNKLKLLDGTIRSDLAGAPATFTPPLDPLQNKGYFEYIENEFADVQGEDSDDILKFTAQAPPGQPFTGRMWVTVPPGQPAMYIGNGNPITITSEYAEIIYFLRNGNLYRRVLLIAPELQSAIVPTVNNVGYPADNQPNVPIPIPFAPNVLANVHVSWQGVNDLSAHPATTGPNTNLNNTAPAWAANTVVLNTLGSLTNRENRYASPRFSDDFFDVLNAAIRADGYFDDLNGDKVPDLYPTLYPNVFNTGLIFAPNYTINAATPLLGFPYLFPGSYSVPQLLQNNNQNHFGWIHSPSPMANVGGANVTFDTNPLAYLQAMNHNPLDLGDNLPTPLTPQSWWGMPTWRETLSVNWTDPTRQINDSLLGFAQPNGLIPRPALGTSVAADTQLLPWVGQPRTVAQGGSLPNNYDFSFIRQTPQLFSDAVGYDTIMSLFLAGGAGIDPVWAVSWEDDLIMTGVRSFDVKAYDNAFAGYADLGWGDDLRRYLDYSGTAGYLFGGNNPPVPTGAPVLGGTPSPALGAVPIGAAPYLFVWPPLVTGTANTYLSTLAHEGRMPPLIEDNRWDASLSGFVGPYTAYNNYTGNIGDDTAGVVRMRRIWDTWSTEYTQAPATGVAPPITVNGALVSTGFQIGPQTGYAPGNAAIPAPPLYPSYPPPYPAPLRGIQIQIRVADPTNQRVKSLTIRQDFTDKLQ